MALAFCGDDVESMAATADAGSNAFADAFANISLLVRPSFSGCKHVAGDRGETSSRQLHTRDLLSRPARRRRE